MYASQRRKKICFGTSRKVQCFYSGETLDTKSRDATIEHLLSVKVAKIQNTKFNLVPAHNRLNSVVGHAPLVVKYRVRDELRSLVMFPGLSEKQRILAFQNAAVQILDSYRISGIRVWEWKHKKFSPNTPKEVSGKIIAKLKKAYRELLTEEEIRIGAYVEGTFE